MKPMRRGARSNSGSRVGPKKQKPHVILSRRSAAKDLRMRRMWLMPAMLRFFAVFAAQNDV
jgi:hypothetical protein